MAKKKSKKQRSAAKAAARREKKRAKRERRLAAARGVLDVATAQFGDDGLLGKASGLLDQFAPRDPANVPESPSTYFTPEPQMAAPEPAAEESGGLAKFWRDLPTLGKVAVGGGGAFALGKLLKVI